MLQSNSENLTKVTSIYDDDIPAVLHACELPFFYRLRTWWRYTMTRSLLSKVVSEIALSTQELVNRYPNTPTLIWEPLYHHWTPPSLLSSKIKKIQKTHYKKLTFNWPCSQSSNDTCLAPVSSAFSSSTSNRHDRSKLVYFYHATITHRHEIKWLHPIVKEVQKILPDAWFELLGDDSMRKLFYRIPRVRVLPAMNWTDYHYYLGGLKYSLGLAPLIDTHFNKARSHTKLYQITSARAAGIFSDLTPYSTKIVHGETGILCKNEPDLWVKAIVDLLENNQQRELLHCNAYSSMMRKKENDLPVITVGE